MIYLETSRLQLRDWEEADLKSFIRLNADEQVMTYFPKSSVVLVNLYSSKNIY
jgi:RimJ/RimL family protein N-acetyltransferase